MPRAKQAVLAKKYGLLLDLLLDPLQAEQQRAPS